MTMTPPRKHLALTIDGGGLRGLIVAQALAALEKEWGGKPLIQHPSLKILAGTSTGTIISLGLALGATAQELIENYKVTAQGVFPLLTPPWFPAFLTSLVRDFKLLTQNSVYSSESLKQLTRNFIRQKTNNPDLTLGELQAKFLRRDQVMLITTLDITNRRSLIIKSDNPDYADWPVWQAVLASSSPPTYLPPIKRTDKNGIKYLTDGGAGSFGNPAYIAAREAVQWRGLLPEEISVFSFGTGWLPAEILVAEQGTPDHWHGLRWAENVPQLLFLNDLARTQSLDIVDDFMMQGLANQPLPSDSDIDFTTWFSPQAMDFRRFQIALKHDVPTDDAAPQYTSELEALGVALGQCVVNDQHALKSKKYDPEGLQDAIIDFVKSRQRDRKRGLST